MTKLSNKAKQLASNQKKKEFVADILKETASPNNTENSQESVSEDEKPKGQKLEIKQNPEGTFEKNKANTKANTKALVLPSNRGSIVTDARDLAKVALIKVEGEKRRVALIAAHEANIKATQDIENTRINDLFDNILEKHEIEASWVTIVAPDLSVINYLIPEKPKG